MSDERKEEVNTGEGRPDSETRPSSFILHPSSFPDIPARSAVAARCALALAFAALYAFLYLRGLAFGRPLYEHVDERGITGQALVMLANKTINPPICYTYGQLPILIQCGLCGLIHHVNNTLGWYTDAEGRPVRKTLHDIAPWDPNLPQLGFAADAEFRVYNRDHFGFYLAGRVTSALYAGVLCCLVYLLSLRLFAHRWIAAAALLAVTVHPLMVQQAHFSLPNMLGALLCVASMYCVVVFLQSNRTWVVYAAAALAGLVLATKFNMGLILLPVLTAAAVRWRLHAVKHLPLLVGVFLAAFTIAEPAILCDTRQYVNEIRGISSSYFRGQTVDTTLVEGDRFLAGRAGSDVPKLAAVLTILYWWHQHKVLLLSAAAGLLSLPLILRWRALIFMLFPITYFLLMGLQQKFYIANYLPLVPFLAVGMGGALLLFGRIVQRVSSRMRVAAALTPVTAICGALWLIVALVEPLQTSLGTVKQLTARDPYQTAAAWIGEHVPRGARILTETVGEPAQLPFPDGPFQVTAKERPLFCRPYFEYADQDYIVTLFPGIQDRYAWARESFLAAKPGSPIVWSFLLNRPINERRLRLARKITPEECGYVAVTVPPLVDHDIFIYQPAEIRQVRSFPLQFRLERNAPSGADGATEALNEVLTRPWLDPGEYDLFLKAVANRGNREPPRIEIQLDTMPAQTLDLFAWEKAYPYFIATMRVEAAKNVNIHVTLLDTQGKNEIVTLEELIGVSVGQPEASGGKDEG